MLNTFFKEKTILNIKSRFGEFIYDVDVNRTLPRKPFFNKDIAKEGLFYIQEIFNTHNIKYFLLFGTCLGAIRDKDFIEYDIDIDLGCYKNNLNEIIKAIIILNKKYNFRILKISKENESITLVYKDIIIDIGLFKKTKQYYIYNNFYENKIPQKFLDKLEIISFLGKEFYVPYDVKNYLLYQYGKRWKIPIKKWNYFEKYIDISFLNLIKELKLFLKGNAYKIKNIKNKFKFKFGFIYKDILKQLNIKNIKSVLKSGQGFCNTYVIKANKDIVIKENCQIRFEYFQKEFQKVEPIYSFLDYKERFLYEKKIFELLNHKKVIINNNIIIFPYIESKLLSCFIKNDNFFNYFKKAILILKNQKISHGDFHIDNILITENNEVCLIDFEMTFSSYLTKDEQFYYDIYYFFAKLEYQYSDFFDENYNKFKKFIDKNFSFLDKEKIVRVADKTKKYFFNVNGARVELFK